MKAQIYASPVLLNGLGALVMLKTEINRGDMHLKKTHERLMRLHPTILQYVIASWCSSDTPENFPFP